MATPSNEELVRRYFEVHRLRDEAAIRALRDPDWAVDWPQSGERVRGHENEWAIMASWPGGTPSAQVSHVVGSEDRWLVTPVNTIQRVVGSGDFWWADGTSDYPDGSTWYFAALLQLRGGRVHRETWYFAEPIEAPAWRAAWVEPIR